MGTPSQSKYSSFAANLAPRLLIVVSSRRSEMEVSRLRIEHLTQAREATALLAVGHEHGN